MLCRRGTQAVEWLSVQGIVLVWWYLPPQGRLGLVDQGVLRVVLSLCGFLWRLIAVL